MTTLELDKAYYSFGGEVEASTTPTICRLPDLPRHQLSTIAQPPKLKSDEPVYPVNHTAICLKLSDDGHASRLGDHWAGAVVGTELGVLSYASPRYDALWQVLSDAKLPLFIHPGSSPDKRLDPFYLSNLLGNPVETTIAAANLIFAGVMHRFPGLNVILAHGGGCVAALCGRWQQGATTDRPDVPELALKPIEAVRRFYVDSLVHSPAYLAAIIDIIGDDKILLGSDWPFPMGAPSAEYSLTHLDQTLKRKIRKTNAETVFGARLPRHNQR